jgi:nucleoside-diphosphate-sugar epimerase
MAGDLVLVTGVTGFLGYLILIDLLKSGYRVRAAVRSKTKLSKILSAPSVKALSPTEDQLAFVIVPDMTAPGAYDEAVKGVKYIIHAASPIPSFGDGPSPPVDQLEELFVKTALRGALGMLKSAHSDVGGTVKRVVMTSSTVAVSPIEFHAGLATPEQVASSIFTPETRIPQASPPYGHEFAAYMAGKAGAINQSEAFIRDNNPSFDLISIIPSWIFGRDELVNDAESMRKGSTNSVLLAVLLGNKSDAANAGNAVLGSDVAKAHVLALAPKIQGNQAFVVSRLMEWEDAISIAKANFPGAFKDGRLRDDGKQPSTPLKWDTSKVRNDNFYDLPTPEC